MERGLDLLLFAAVPRAAMLEQGFYAAEVDGLCRDPRVRGVTATNSLQEVRRAKVDGIVSYFYSHSAAVGAIARARGIPIIATGGCEQLQRDETTTPALYAKRAAAFHACTLVMDRLLATCTADFNRMLEVARFGRAKIEVSFHGVAAAERSAPELFQLPRAPGALVTIAGLDTELNVRRKGVLRAVDLLARFAARYSDASLTIIGRDTCRAMVEAYAMALGVGGRVRFTGYVEEDAKIDLLRQSRFYVQLSDYEGFGIGAIEALSQGCCVIHSGVGGLIDTIGTNGILCRRDEIADFEVDRKSVV